MKLLKFRREREDIIENEIERLERIIEENLRERIALKESLRLELSEAERQRNFKERQLMAAEGIDAEVLKKEIDEIERRIEELKDMFGKLAEDVTEAKSALINLRWMKVNSKLKPVDESWKESIRNIRVGLESSSGDNLRAVCSEIKKLSEQSRNLRLVVLEDKKIKREV
ncbi:hypothetical protein DRP04_07405 [Archaeoglobales archaeon]|nr:MAG: hypothetical protein DRP04_07405 [Archaeoglobales archaeon]